MLSVVIVFRRCRAHAPSHAPAIYAAGHGDHEKRVVRFPFSMHVYGLGPIVMLRLAAPRSAGAPLK